MLGEIREIGRERMKQERKEEAREKGSWQGCKEKEERGRGLEGGISHTV